MPIQLPTPQELFNAAWQHFIVEQNPLSLSGGNTSRCMHRGKDGAKCVIGLVISDDEYHRDLEDHSVYDLIDMGYLVPQGGIDAAFYEEAQQWLHDNFASMQERTDLRGHMRDSYVAFTHEYGLEIPS